MNTTLEQVKIEFENDKSAFLKKMECALKIKIDTVEIISNNGVFNNLLANNLTFELLINSLMDFQIRIECKEFFTLVERKKGSVLKYANTLTIFLEDGSHIRCSSFQEDSIEISRVWVNPMNHRNGIGSMLMNLLFELIQFSESEPSSYFLECTGAVGLGDNAQTIGIDIQTKFFRKFGFRVDYRKEYPHYVTMIMKPKKLTD
jgi:GNAT superfamily N-acetyltransferase